VSVDPTRRKVLAAGAGWALAPATAWAGDGASPVAAALRIDPPDLDPADRLETVIRVVGRSDGGVAVRWTDGVLSAVVGAETTPLLRVMSQIYSRHRRRADGGWDAVLLELVYFVDLRSRELLRTWRNPFTGQDVPVPQTTLGPTPFTIRPSLVAERDPALMAGGRLDHHYEIDLPGGDDLWVTESLDSVIPSPAPGLPPFGFHEYFAFHASRAALAARDRPHLPCTVQKTNVLGWRPWMLMGDRPGTTLTRAAGRVLDDPGALPPAFLALNRDHGRGVLDGLEKTLSP
jgi:hypothetical protein